jgi:hypothetical protein
MPLVLIDPILRGSGGKVKFYWSLLVHQGPAHPITHQPIAEVPALVDLDRADNAVYQRNQGMARIRMVNSSEKGTHNNPMMISESMPVTAQMTPISAPPPTHQMSWLIVDCKAW